MSNVADNSLCCCGEFLGTDQTSRKKAAKCACMLLLTGRHGCLWSGHHLLHLQVRLGAAVNGADLMEPHSLSERVRKSEECWRSGGTKYHWQQYGRARRQASCTLDIRVCTPCACVFFQFICTYFGVILIGHSEFNTCAYPYTCAHTSFHSRTDGHAAPGARARCS